MKPGSLQTVALLHLRAGDDSWAPDRSRAPVVADLKGSAARLGHVAAPVSLLALANCR